MEIFTDDWVDAKEMNYKYPNTFDYPTQSELDNIKIRDSVKISNGFERFWVEVKEKNKIYFIGRVDNELLTNEYKLDDFVMFESKNIYEIRTKEDKELYFKKILKYKKKNKLF
tara:strand:- start:766 stop:1104 length:339 start_codon:yes stop_codon:yes gene_type:complete